MRRQKVKYLFMKTYEDMKVQRHIFLIWTLDRVNGLLQASVALPSRKTSSTSWIGGWVAAGAGLKDVKKAAGRASE